MSQLKAFSQITGDEIAIGPATEDLDAILGLGEMAAAHHDLIVYVEGPALQKWESS